MINFLYVLNGHNHENKIHYRHKKEEPLRINAEAVLPN